MRVGNLDSLIEKYKLRIDLTQPIELPSYSSTKAFKVKSSELEEDFLDLYVLDILEGRQIACYPHLVGAEFDRLNKACASKASKAIYKIAGFKQQKHAFLHLHLLRAAPGYRLWEAFKKIGVVLPQLWIRPRYKLTSYRDHLSEDRSLEIIYKDFECLPKNKDLVIVIPDTIASGHSMNLSIGELIKVCSQVNSKLKQIILYGFISLDGLKLLQEKAKKLEVKLIAFALESLTPLASNKYDMPLYGVDESYWEKAREIKRVGGIVDLSTLKSYLPEYVPGCDQPGDFSARQTKLFNGLNYEKGDIKQHLINTIKLIKRLEQIPNCFEPWQAKIAEAELVKLRGTLPAY